MSDSRSKLSRRTLFAGAGVAGAVAAFTRVLPQDSPPDSVASPVAKPKPKRGGGYSLSDHVKQYYETTRH